MSVALTLAFAVQASTGSTGPAPGHSGDRVPPVATAVRVARPPALDGRLDDPAWASATPLTEFTQLDPDEGQPVSERTEVRLVYTADALYIGARLYDREPARIEKRLGRRDSFVPSDEFAVILDSYHDHRTSFHFHVNPAGVKRDWVAGDDQGGGDDSWDPVWDVATSVDSAGWVAEIAIPFSQLRFSQASEQVWGVQFIRHIFRRAEQAYFAPRLRTESGFASRFGHLTGLADIPAPKRVELLPYSVGRGTYDRTVPAGDPFNDGSVYFGGVGLDLKYGLSSNLTLDATINPDFGQVEIDPAFVNLSAFEQFLSERRPFFVEGASIFAFGGGVGGGPQFGGSPRYFYSRRIGRPPQGSPETPDGGFSDTPDNATIIGAAKITGKTSGGWSVGVLDAVTAAERAVVQDGAGTRWTASVEPLTNYLVGRLKREFRGGGSGLGLLATAMNRDIDTTSLELLRGSAYLGGVDFFHRWAGNAYAVAGAVAGSYVLGSPEAITLTQRSSSRYYDRPDAGHVALDSARTSLAGVTGDLAFRRIAGDWLGGVAFSTTTPGFELNDLGFQTRVDRISLAADVLRRWTTPGKVLRSANVGLFIGPSWNYDGDRIQNVIGLNAFGQLLNYWGGFLFGNLQLPALDDRLTRGGPVTARPRTFEVGGGFFTDQRQRVLGEVFSFYAGSESGGWFWRINGQLGIRPSAAVSLDLGPGYFTGRTVAQYVTAVDDATGADTFGRRYVFGELLQHSVDMSIRANVTFSPALTFQLYVQPFSFAGDYSGFKELRAPRTFDFNPFNVAVSGTDEAGRPAEYRVDPDGTGPAASFTFTNPDFRTRSLRTNAVVRWEYRPGSTLFVVWTQSRSGFFPFDPRFDVGRDFRRELFSDKPVSVLLIKLNYWLSL